MNRSAPGMLLTVAALLACPLGAACSKESHADAAPKAEAQKIHVETTTVEEQKVPKVLHLTGELSSNERTDLAANATGRVLKTFVERGDHVVQGALLAQLDARAAALTRAEAEANVASAKAQLTNAEADCQRYDGLLAKGAITKQEYDRQRTSCVTQAAGTEAAKVRAAEAAQTLGDSAVRAPFGGVIAERFVHVGDYVHPDTRIVTLLVDDPLRLELTVPEANVASVHTGLAVTFETVALPGRTFTATVKFLGREIREATRDLVVEAVTANADGVLLPGMFVSAEFPVGETTSPVLPQKSILHHDENDSVFVVVDQHLVERIVQLGPKVGDAIAISDGVKKGDRVVVAPPDNAADGVEVQ